MKIQLQMTKRRTAPTLKNGTVPPKRVPNAERRPREYLTQAEVKKLIEVARKRGRYGPRDALMILVAFIGWVGVLAANSFAATQVRLQPERGQRVISTGPYGVVRHPMYAYSLLLMIGAPLLLGSLWGLLGLALFVPLLAARLLGEEAMLMEGLPGYRDYAAKVRFRLVPGVW